ncbi:MAG TPA: methylenetetrahydrofolate reductase [Burkholderiales bacterium]|nr:methylenetetrahydrofolate reductase [Burkholderiales bacterium]
MNFPMVEERRAASELHSRLRGGEFVVTAEITPPVSTDPAEFLQRALPLRGLATAVNVTDGAGAKVHLSSLAAAHFLAQSGIEPIFQMTCRDRNRLALQGDLLGAVALGIRNILVLHGDDPKVGDQPDAKPVFDLDSRKLLALANAMRREGKLPSGTEIHGKVPLVIGAADMPIDPQPGWEPKGLAAKLEAGADFAQTQFCMDMGVVRRYAARLVEAGIAQRLPILIGVSPIPSARSARWMREKLYGTIIPDEIVRRLEGAEDAKREGARICVEVLQQLAEIPGVAGAHIMAPQNFAAIPQVISESGVIGRKRRL